MKKERKMGSGNFPFSRLPLVKNCLFLMGLGAGFSVLHTELIQIFQTNLIINSLILATFFLGIGYTFFQFFILFKEDRWVKNYFSVSSSLQNLYRPFLLAPLFHFKREEGRPLPGETLLSAVDGRLQDFRTFTRYIMGVLVFLGLLGTFWGLSQTVGAIGQVIGGLNLGGGDMKGAFDTLKEGLHSPLKGMGTAFSSSMMGVGGSVILGFLDLQVGRSCQKFYHLLEDQLMALGMLGRSQGGGGDLSYGPAYAKGLLEQTAENMSILVQAFTAQHENRTTVVRSVQTLTDQLSELTQVLRHQKKQMDLLKNQQERVQEILEYWAASLDLKALSQTWEKTDHQLSTLCSFSGRLLEESIQGRQALSKEIRSEIRLLAKIISSLGEVPEEG